VNKLLQTGGQMGKPQLCGVGLDAGGGQFGHDPAPSLWWVSPAARS
jgi:hypothetical protein